MLMVLIAVRMKTTNKHESPSMRLENEEEMKTLAANSTAFGILQAPIVILTLYDLFVPVEQYGVPFEHVIRTSKLMSFAYSSVAIAIEFYYNRVLL